MYDNVNFRIRQDEVGGVDFLSEIPCYLENVGEHRFNDEVVVTGSLDGLKVVASRRQVTVKDGSFCKYYLGDNFQTMGRGDTKRAVEKLSDDLHLPIRKAAVTRLDIAQNFIVRQPPENYFNHFGELKYYKRGSMIEAGSLYYIQKHERLNFYDKNREQKSKGQPIPPLYDGRNVLRYEQRYMGRVATQLGVSDVTGALLYDEAFYIRLLNRWRDSYKAIQKLNDITLNFDAMITKQGLYKMGVLSLVEKVGGQLQMIEQIKEAYRAGTLTKKQAHDLRQAVIEACKVKEGLTVPNEAIAELDKKVCEAVKFYR
jgi:hypothetical protein